MTNDFIIVGRFGAPFGVKGEIKVISFCDPEASILEYDPWYVCIEDEWQEVDLASKRSSTNGVVVGITGIDDRDEIKALTNKEIAVGRGQLADTEDDEYYWSDLEGLAVKTNEGEYLGVVNRVMATGANDVIVVEGEKKHLIPFILDHFISKVDLNSRELIVNWDPEN